MLKKVAICALVVLCMASFASAEGGATGGLGAGQNSKCNAPSTCSAICNTVADICKCITPFNEMFCRRVVGLIFGSYEGVDNPGSIPAATCNRLCTEFVSGYIGDGR